MISIVVTQTVPFNSRGSTHRNNGFRNMQAPRTTERGFVPTLDAVQLRVVLARILLNNGQADRLWFGWRGRGSFGCLGKMVGIMVLSCTRMRQQPTERAGKIVRELEVAQE